MQEQNYWVGQVPTLPMFFSVRTQDGTERDLTAYTTIQVVMLGSDNEPIDTSGGAVTVADRTRGKVIYNWPTDRSLFDKHGEYVVQLRLSSPTADDYTSRRAFHVRQLGGI